MLQGQLARPAGGRRLRRRGAPRGQPNALPAGPAPVECVADGSPARAAACGLVASMLVLDPAGRPTAAACLAHPFLAGNSTGR